jgi:outer membrane autotransporter protein
VSASNSDAIYNDGTINSLSTTGTIVSSNDSGVFNTGTVNTLINNGGTISGGDEGVLNGDSRKLARVGDIGSISLLASTVDSEMSTHSSALIDTLSNTGLITGGSNGVGIDNYGTINALTNAETGTIMGSTGLSNTGTIAALSNAGIVEGLSFSGVANESYGTINALTNADTGTIVGNSGLSNSGTIASLVNAGFIEGTTASGIYNGSSGTIASLVNTGLVQGGSSDAGVYNEGTVGSLENAGTINGGSYSIRNTGVITDGITNTGTLVGNADIGSATLTLQGTLASVQGDVFGSGSVLVGGSSSATKFTTEGNISVSGGITVDNTGTLTISNGDQLGDRLVNQGRVFIDSSSNVSVSGQRGTVTGSYLQEGVLAIGATSASNYGQLTVTGAATLSPTASFDVDVKSINTLAVGEVLENVLSAQTLTGTTATGMTVTDNSYLLSFYAQQDGTTAVDLNVIRGSIQQAAEDAGFGPGVGAGGALDDIVDGCFDNSSAAVCQTLSGFIDALNQEETEQGVSEVLAEALPLMQTNMQQSILGAQQQVINVIDSRQTGGQASGDGWLTQRQMWFKPLVSRLEQDGVGNVAGYKANTGGFVIGAEGSLDATNRLGLALAYTNTRVKGRVTTQTHDAKFDGYQLIAYGTSEAPMFGNDVNLNWQADIGFGSTKGQRSAFDGVAYADYKSNSVHVGAGLSREMPLGDGISITPTIRADYTTLRDKGYTESGDSSLTLIVNKRTTDQFIVTAGAKVSKPLTTDWLLSGTANLGVDLINEASVMASRFTAGGPLFSTTGIKPKAWVGTLGLNLQYKPSETVTWEFGYDMSARSNYMDHTMSVKIKWAF